mmetsp:Transcript_14374/g.33084  ORF Transcript_14374/g.33084 Transcript_14374/m.33084 type:complete len:507 (-) Transcript_14374:144-1664(-)
MGNDLLGTARRRRNRGEVAVTACRNVSPYRSTSPSPSSFISLCLVVLLSCLQTSRSFLAPVLVTQRRTPTPLLSTRVVQTCSKLHMSSSSNEDMKDFLAVSLLGSNLLVDRKDPLVFLAPTLEFGDDGFALQSRLATSDSFTVSGQRRAVPIPVASNEEVSLLASLRSFEEAVPNKVSNRYLSLLEKSQAVIATKQLWDALPFEDVGPEARKSALEMISREPDLRSHLEIVQRLWAVAACVPYRVVIDEIPSLYDGSSVTLGGSIVFGRSEEEGCEQAKRILTSPASSIAFATKFGSPIYIRKDIYKETCCRIVNLGDDGERNKYSIDESQPVQWRTPKTAEQFMVRVQESQKNAKAREEALRKETWELKAADLQGMTQEQLRFLLAEEGVPSSSQATKEELQDLILPRMDELERRIIMIQRAVEREEYGTASQLAANQSRRGRIAAAIVEAVREERYYEAAQLQEELEVITMGRADITQDEGSYDPYLDADDWYVRDLMRRRKGM